MNFPNASDSTKKLNPHLFARTGFDVPIQHGEPREIQLHNKIIDWCNSQWPKVKYIHANPAVKSTISKGCQDFTLFLKGRVLCVECKSKDGKLSDDQRDWAHEMGLLDHKVHIVRNMEQFLEVVTEKE